ncbi:hypothetical protein ASD11_14355 [Aeromicrobium sp. Root495]|uniref:MlaD family protein n=1 Tax=Aeromicrobium sp. Root495 TaxID=1736550 RepID=UPI0006F30434|nr:MlaD family protein [Aeromicrobium sp. Root495]KQY55693.1 hypothetical protein ASD11_14355 [Aeromicrobium sp. Root495]
MKSSRHSVTVLGLLVILGFVAALYTAIFASTGLPGQTHTVVKARFSEVGGLRVGDDVRQASSRVGQVRSIDLQKDVAVVTLQLDGDRSVYKDAKARLWARSSLGQNFVELSPGTAKAGSLGTAEIAQTSTTPASELDDLLSVLDKPTRTALATTLRETGGGLSGHSQDFSAFLKNGAPILKDLGTVSQAATSDQADLPALLASADRLASRFEGNEEAVTSLLGQLDDTLAAVGADEGNDLTEILEKAPSTLDETKQALGSLQEPLADLDVTVNEIKPGAEAMGRATSDLRKTLRDGRKPLGKVPDVADQAEPALEDLTDMMADARPLAPKLEKTFKATSSAAQYMAPYAAEISQFFDYWSSANGSGDASGHWLRLGFVVRPETVLSATNLKDPLSHRNTYPKPGQAQKDRADTLLGNR